MNSTTTDTKPRRFTRSKNDKVVSGVAGGLGEYFDVDPVLFRIGLVVAAFMTTGLAVVAYFVLALRRDYEAGGDITAVEAPAPTVGVPTPVAA